MAGRKNLFEPVAEKLMLQIREGRLAPGEKMPRSMNSVDTIH